MNLRHTVGAAVIIKGATMAAVIWAVLNSELSTFEKALIIAAVSATITGVFTVVGAFVAAHYIRPVRMHMEQISEDVNDVKGKVNANQRASDE